MRSFKWITGAAESFNNEYVKHPNETHLFVKTGKQSSSTPVSSIL